jgi:hypothetical protein
VAGSDVRTALVAFVAAATFSLAKVARADERFTLAWDAPAECPDESRVAAAIGAWLDQPHPAGAGSVTQPVRVDAKVTASPGGLAIDLTLDAAGGSEHQTLVAARCETLVELVAVKVALAVDPLTLLGSLGNHGPETLPAERPRFGLRGDLGAGLGPLPGASAFLSLAVSAELPDWRVEVAATAWLPTDATYIELPSVGANFTLLTGSARACLLPSMGAVDFPLCGGAEVGLMRGSGFGVQQVATSDQLWAAGVVGPSVRWTLGPALSFWIGADAVIGIVRPSYQMRNLEQLYRPDAVAARTWAGLEVRL